ncbi:MAG: D-sedoheptulose 7-phosphate isomerase [Bacteroidales bacterium]|nr:D-sedoheptulose 7-phosphate isomerase [Bacteroidales bacterium]
MDELRNIITDGLAEAKSELDAFINDPLTAPSIMEAANLMATCLTQGGKIISCGNGGSLCDATHFAEELTGRFRDDRRPLPAIAINDPAYITCVGNDYSFEDVFSRWVEAFGKTGDILLAISTSGSSKNILKAAEAARRLGLKVVALTSKKGKSLAELADVVVAAPDAPHSDRIQEIHIKVIHILIQSIESLLTSSR